MTWLYILLGIILFFAFLLSLKVKLRVKYKGGELVYVLSCLGITLKRSPLPEIKRPINYKKFTYKKHKKRLLKERLERRSLQQQKYKNKKEKAPDKSVRANKKSSPSKTEVLGEALGFVWIFIKHFAKRLHVKIVRLRLNVAKDDAASTAIAYGAAVQSVNYFIEFIGNVMNLDKIDHADLEVSADYTGSHTHLDLYFIFHLRIYNIVGLVFGVVFDFVKKLAENSPYPNRFSHSNRPGTALKNSKKPSATVKKSKKASN